jgi:cell division protease FtsH
MVCEWGMSDAMGPLTFGKKEEQIFLGREIAQHQDYSEDTALKIDAEVKRFVMDAYSRATELLSTHKKELLDIADALLAREVLDADQVTKLARGEALPDLPPSVAPRPTVDDQTRDRGRDKERPPLVPQLPKPLTQE